MKKMLLALTMMLVLALMLPLTGFAEETAPAAAAPAEAVAPAPAPAAVSPDAVPAVKTPVEQIDEWVKLIPNSDLHYNLGILINGDVMHGPAFDLAKLWQFVYVQAMWAKILNHGGGSFGGVDAQATINDIIKACHGEPGKILLTLNPGIGLTGGYKFGASTTGPEHSGITGGVIFNAANVNLEKLGSGIASVIDKIF